jgi:hypothetical protein
MPLPKTSSSFLSVIVGGRGKPVGNAPPASYAHGVDQRTLNTIIAQAAKAHGFAKAFLDRDCCGFVIVGPPELSAEGDRAAQDACQEILRVFPQLLENFRGGCFATDQPGVGGSELPILFA